MHGHAFWRGCEVWLRESLQGRKLASFLRWIVLVVLLSGGTVTVYATGGTQYVWPHLMYFPVVLAGVWLGRRAGVATGVVAGLLMGPLMPLDVTTAIAQPTRGWLVRMGFYVAVGAMAGYARYRFYRLLERRRTFVSSVSHELRTPLAAVVGFAEILNHQWDDVTEAEKHELVGHLLRESVEVAHVVDDLMVAARIDGGRLHIDCDYVDVRDIADSILANLPSDSGRERIQLVGAAQSWADPLRVRQIIRNLVTNALTYGGEHVTIDLSNDQDTVIVTVQDDGAGIPDMIVPRLFEPFVDRSDSSATMPQSVGLGLAVSRELARRMGGRLSYRRHDARTIFTLELPATPTANPKSVTVPSHLLTRHPANSPKP